MRTSRWKFLLLCATFFLGCADPYKEPLPKVSEVSNARFQSALQKLRPEERVLVTDYLIRTGGPSAEGPKTVGEALSAQRAFVASAPPPAVVAPPASTSAPLPPRRGGARVTAPDLVDDYESNGLRAASQWNGRFVAVMGKVRRIDRDIRGKAFVVLDADDEHPLAGVQCFFSEELADTAAKVSKGDKITVQGTVEGRALTNVVVRDSEIIERNGATIPESAR
ncbi:MAG TPA: hypothetical protein VM925_25170 [Labilithrix sp.]|nr:hypothetical protein [Labilithrix sp.]